MAYLREDVKAQRWGDAERKGERQEKREIFESIPSRS
jgi:hypothetical protein